MTEIEALPDEQVRGPMGNGTEWFDEECAVAHLLVRGKVFLSGRMAEAACLFVICNDVFMWACSDAEALPYSEIKNLYEMDRKDPEWGAAVWACQRRKMMPQRPLEKMIRDAGIWDLDSMGLDPTP